MRLIKAHAYGNDFLILESAALPPTDLPDLARRACARHDGIGADGLVIATRTERGAETRLFNRDGSTAEVSGNGVRCVAAWLAHARGLAHGASLDIGTAAGTKTAVLLDSDPDDPSGSRYTFRVSMGEPGAIAERQFDLAGGHVEAIVLSMGNPQCVVFGDLTEDRLATIGGGLATHPAFPDGTNVELVRVESPSHLSILIWERGVGPTSSSGTGTCAAAVAAMTYRNVNRSVQVAAPGGSQRVEWTGEGVFLEGWASLTAVVEWPIGRVSSR